MLIYFAIYSFWNLIHQGLKILIDLFTSKCIILLLESFNVRTKS